MNKPRDDKRESITIPAALYAELLEWFDKFAVSPIIHHQQLPARLRGCAVPSAIARDWTEDFDHENGRYQCQCMDCDNLFIGHKRRVQCKACFDARRNDGPTPSSVAPINDASNSLGEFVTAMARGFGPEAGEAARSAATAYAIDIQRALRSANRPITERKDMKIKLNEESARALRDWIGEGNDVSEITLHVGDGHNGHGLYASATDYPEEGAEFIAALDR